jgi:hypothetical protein
MAVRWIGAATLAVVAALAATAVAGLLPTRVPPLALGDLSFEGYARVAHLDAYEDPVTAVGYTDGEQAVVRIPLRHIGDGGAVTVLAVDPFPEVRGLLEVETVAGLPVTLHPGQRATVEVRARFTNCRFYTERAVNHFERAAVTVAAPLGRRTVAVDHTSAVVLRSPTILGCPDRVVDRSARQRLLARDE